MYDNNTVYIVGEARTNIDNAITNMFNSFFIGFVVDVNTDEIIDVSCTSTIRTTEDFIKCIFTGKSFSDYRFKLEDEIKKRYHGSSQRAIIVAYKDAIKKYVEVKQKYY